MTKTSWTDIDKQLSCIIINQTSHQKGVQPVALRKSITHDKEPLGFQVLNDWELEEYINHAIQCLLEWEILNMNDGYLFRNVEIQEGTNLAFLVTRYKIAYELENE